MTFGQKITIEHRDGKKSEGRAGTYFKQAVPSHFFKDNFILYLDADEYLFLPPGCNTLAALVNRMRMEGVSNLVASIVEFFPEQISDLEIPIAPKSLADLLSVYPYFQFEQLIDFTGNGAIITTNDSKTTRLFKRHHLVFRTAKRKPSLSQRLIALLQRRNPHLYNIYRKSPRYKAPLLHVREDSYFTGSHEGNLPGSQDLMLTIAHFVYTYQLPSKIERAREWRSYARNSLKYDLLLKLIEKMRTENSSFLDKKSVRFESVAQFLKCGLMIQKK